MFFDILFYRWKKNPAVLNSKQSSMKEILSKSLASRDMIFLRLAKRFKNASKIEMSILYVKLLHIQ